MKRLALFFKLLKITTIPVVTLSLLSNTNLHAQGPTLPFTESWSSVNTSSGGRFIPSSPYTLNGIKYSWTGGTGINIQIGQDGGVGGSKSFQITNFSGSPFVLTIESADGSEFDLESFQASGGFGSGTISMKPFKDGSELSGCNNPSVSAGFIFSKIEPNDDYFNNVDKVEMEFSASGVLDDLQFLEAGTNSPACGGGVSDTNPPLFDIGPSVSSVTISDFTLEASIDEAGDVFYVVLASGAAAPTAAEVINGTGSGGVSTIASGSALDLADPFSLSALVSGLSSGTTYSVYVVARDDESPPNVQMDPTKVDVTTLAPTSATVAATVLLEGAFNGVSMNTTLSSSIPLIQPYNFNGHSAGSASSIPSGAVDWVLVELREAASATTANNATKVGSAAGFLMSDGSIKATDGIDDLTISLSGNSHADFFVVVYHRNHLPIMSANTISESGGTYTIDFTTSSSHTYQGTTALSSLSGGKFGMIAGDQNADGEINGADLTNWRSQNGGVYSYSGSSADFNLDGQVNSVDRNDHQRPNAGKSRQVPSN